MLGFRNRTSFLIMDKEYLEELQAKLQPTYWNAKVVDKLWNDILNQDATMVNRLNLERFKSVLDAMIVKTIQNKSKAAQKQLETLEEMKAFYDRIAKILAINKVQADIITTFTMESYKQGTKIDELENELKKLRNIDKF